jgi:hypothetical protein
LKIENRKHFVRLTSRITAVIVLLKAVFALSGCAALSFLLSSGPFEKKVPPAYDLQAQQERKVMIWIECPRSVNADYDLKGKLAEKFRTQMIEIAEFEEENLVPMPDVNEQMLLLDPKKIARGKGAGYLLLVQVDVYETDFLQIRDYYSGEMITRAILFDTDSGESLWPKYPEGKMIHIAIEMETKGRDALVTRLTSATAHCILRNLYPCDKLKYDAVDERPSLQEVYEMETY